MRGYKCYLVFFFLTGFSPCLRAQKNPAVDVQHYRFKIAVNDSDDIIRAEADIDFIARSGGNNVYFDLDARHEAAGKGMQVTGVTEGSRSLRFSQDSGRVYIYYDSPLHPGDKKEVRIAYHGIPADGLIIGRNEFGSRTFFADNWPMRAHYWIPCNDHPSDKASVEFIVTAPCHYRVVGNGVLAEETSLPGKRRLTHWKEDLALPTKVMAIGIADFATQLVGTVDHIPIQSWVFSENRDSGFAQYGVSAHILPFYIRYIGPYPYKKLANVQSKTKFGGLENASNIFYNEKSVALRPGDPSGHRIRVEELMAHETAHQWFGDEVTETDWPHLWLSEGFATYLTNLYFESHYGEDTLRARLMRDRKTVTDFYKKRKTPVVDTLGREAPMQLLNPNSYQKGGWILHMLRRKLGDRLFREGLRAYYLAYRGGNASTGDFRKVMEQVSRQDLDTFFRQWLYTPGQPTISGKWYYDAPKKIVSVTIGQIQDSLFAFPLQIGIQADDSMAVRTLSIHKRRTTIHIPFPGKPGKLVLDPDVNLLFEGEIKESEAR